MGASLTNITAFFKGEFIVSPEILSQKLQSVKAFVFDWDGVFNNGEKNENGSSFFNEVDAMGTNLLRFNHHLLQGKPPVTAIITGERNKAALAFAGREHLHAVYCGIKYKADALKHLCEAQQIKPEEVAFMFDDVLDFSAAALCGLRIMVKRDSNPLMIDYAKRHGLVDYVTANSGANHAIRETAELLTGISGRYEDTMTERAMFTDIYKQYLAQRNEAQMKLFTVSQSEIIEIKSL